MKIATAWASSAKLNEPRLLSLLETTCGEPGIYFKEGDVCFFGVDCNKRSIDSETKPVYDADLSQFAT